MGSSHIAGCLLVILVIAVITEAVPSPHGLQRKPSESARRKAMEKTANLPNMREGDMVFTDEQTVLLHQLIAMEKTGFGSSRRKRSDEESSWGEPEIFQKAINNLNYRWTGGIVPYALNDDNHNEETKQLIRAAMRHWELRTCLRFRPTSTELQEELGHNHYINFIVDGGCYSYVGMIPSFSDQPISIGRGCEWLDIIAHEIGHAIGFHHEQSRPNRDEYITVHLDNVVDGYQRQFDKYSSQQIEDGDVPYDIGSVMHYSPTAFSSNGQPTITVREDNEQPAEYLGAAQGLSCTDVRLANIIYECSDDGRPYYDCDEEEEGVNYEFDPDDIEDPEEDGGYKVEMVLENRDTDEIYWGGTENEGHGPAGIVPGRDYTVLCWQSDKVRHSSADDVLLQMEFDGDVVDAEEGFDDNPQYGDPSSNEGGRPYIYYSYTATAEDLHKVFTCTISSASEDVEVVIPTRTNVLHPRCEQLFHVPCGDECVNNFGLQCNGEEDCPGGTDEDDFYCDREESCTGVFVEEGEVSSPGFPENYPDEAFCAQLIRAPANLSVVLSFNEFQLEEDGQCRWDSLDVFDGFSTDHHHIGSFCGDSIPDDIVSSHRDLLLVFRSDGSVAAPGYSANFRFRNSSGRGGRRTVTIKEFYGGFVGLVDIPINEDAQNWRVKLTFPLRIKSIQISDCDAAVVDRRQKLEYFIENKRNRGALSEGDRLRFEFTAITSRKQKGAVAEIQFMVIDG